MTVPESESFSIVRVALGFIAVFGLLAGFGFALKFITQHGIKFPGMATGNRRLQIVESLPLDVHRRLVIVRCDDVEHLLLLGHNQDIVVAGSLNRNHLMQAPVQGSV